jgi:hypothetical protein
MSNEDDVPLAAPRSDESDRPAPSIGRCPRCGQRCTLGRTCRARSWRGAFALAGLLLLATVGAALVVIHRHDRDEKKQQATTLARRLAREERAEEAKALPALEARLDRSIAADARKLARAGALDGPILGATCTPLRAPASTGANSSTESYNCIAIRRRRGRTIEGARFFATIDARTGGFTFGGD